MKRQLAECAYARPPDAGSRVWIKRSSGQRGNMAGTAKHSHDLPLGANLGNVRDWRQSGRDSAKDPNSTLSGLPRILADYCGSLTRRVSKDFSVDLARDFFWSSGSRYVSARPPLQSPILVTWTSYLVDKTSRPRRKKSLAKGRADPHPSLALVKSNRTVARAGRGNT